jgi:DNA modification methylase
MRSTLWAIDTIPNGPERPDHPTPKPLEVFEIPMRQHTKAGQLCYEPFAGSGTQIIAAERTRRRCFAMEISPHYCDVIVRRWLHLVGPSHAPKALVKRYVTGGRADSRAGQGAGVKS